MIFQVFDKIYKIELPIRIALNSEEGKEGDCHSAGNS